MPAITTPFHADGTLDAESYTANIDRLMGAGATGIVAAGCTGEFWAMPLNERAELARVTVEALGGRGPTIIGTGAIRAEEVIDQIQAARDVGADGVLVMPPFFAHLTSAEIISHFASIDAAASGMPIMIYNIPGNAGNAITPAIADRLVDMDHIVAIKESSSDWRNFHETLLLVRDRARVFCGPSSVFGVAAVLAGADGLIDCFPNVWAPGCLDLWHATRAGQLDDALALQRTGLALTELFTTEGRTLYPATKAAMNLMGLPGGGYPRAPLLPLDGPALCGLAEGLKRILGADVITTPIQELHHASGT